MTNGLSQKKISDFNFVSRFCLRTTEKAECYRMIYNLDFEMEKYIDLKNMPCQVLSILCSAWQMTKN